MCLRVFPGVMKNETPEYLSYYDPFPAGKKLTPGTFDYEYYHFTKQMGRDGVVASGGLTDQKIMYLRCSRTMARKIIHDLPSLGSWHFSGNNPTSFRVDIVIEKDSS